MTESVEVTYPARYVGQITINRPGKSNSIDPATNAAMEQALHAFELDASVRCIIITGAGPRAFCAGADIPVLLPALRAGILSGQDDPQFCGATHRQTTRKPLIAAINGVALGGGLELALACDLRIAAAHARFGLPEINVGVLAAGGGCTRLPRTIPSALAAEMILTGEPIDSQRALQTGLVSNVVEAEALLPTAIALASRIATRAPQALRACVELLRRPRFSELDDALRHERAVFTQVLLSSDAEEGIQAFIEKRQPAYSNPDVQRNAEHVEQ